MTVGAIYLTPPPTPPKNQRILKLAKPMTCLFCVMFEKYQVCTTIPEPILETLLGDIERKWSRLISGVYL